MDEATEPARAMMLATPEYESRTDTAELSIKLEGAPVLEYTHRHWSSRTDPQLRRWQPGTARIVWDTGVLVKVRVSGHRLKKDGKPGVLRDNFTYRVDGHGRVKPMKSEDFNYPIGWVQKLIDLYAECPKPGARDENGERLNYRGDLSPRTPATILLPSA